MHHFEAGLLGFLDRLALGRDAWQLGHEDAEATFGPAPDFDEFRQKLFGLAAVRRQACRVDPSAGSAESSARSD